MVQTGDALKIEIAAQTQAIKVDVAKAPDAPVKVDVAPVAKPNAAAKVDAPAAPAVPPNTAHTDTTLVADVKKNGDSKIVANAVAQGSGTKSVSVSAYASASSTVDDDGTVHLQGTVASDANSDDVVKLHEDDAVYVTVDPDVFDFFK